MPKLISHRGLLNGPDPVVENTEKQITLALNLGYDVETDVRWIKNEWWIGHDSPAWRCEENFLQQPGLWLHAKNLEALHHMIKLNLNCFWHQNDDYVVTNHGYIWCYPGKAAGLDNTVIVMPEWIDPSLNICRKQNCYGICSDYIKELAEYI